MDAVAGYAVFAIPILSFNVFDQTPMKCTRNFGSENYAHFLMLRNAYTDQLLHSWSGKSTHQINHAVLHCVSKNACHYISDHSLNKNCPIVIIFGTLTTQTIAHRKVVSFSHLTYLLHCHYLGKY